MNSRQCVVLTIGIIVVALVVSFFPSAPPVMSATPANKWIAPAPGTKVYYTGHLSFWDFPGGYALLVFKAVLLVMTVGVTLGLLFGFKTSKAARD